MCLLLIKVCWEREWRAKYRKTYKFCVLPHVSCVPSRWESSLSFPPLSIHGAKNIEPQPGPKDTEFWMTTHQFYDCSFRTQGQWQGPKVKAESKGEEGSVSGMQVPSGRSNAIYGTCEGDLSLIHRCFWRLIIYWGSERFESTKHFYTGEKVLTFSDNMNEISCLKVLKNVLAIYQTPPPFILQVRGHNLNNR
jgi:hypothetical protein